MTQAEKKLSEIILWSATADEKIKQFVFMYDQQDKDLESILTKHKINFRVDRHSYFGATLFQYWVDRYTCV